jgi:flavin reductase (DIM6/NTAB) family NADH-FMN oxidoreductase RutF
MTMSNPADLPSIPSRQFWPALAGRSCGVAVVTTRLRDERAGLLALSVTHFTADPPILMLSIGTATSALPLIRESGILAVNYLSRLQTEIADIFGGKRGIRGDDRFMAGSWGALKTGAPVLDEAISALDCVVCEMIERFSTMLVLARVVDFSDSGRDDPLTHFRGGYR